MITIDEIKRLDANRTQGNWKGCGKNGGVFVMSDQVQHPNANGYHDLAYLCTSNGCGIKDANFIAAAPKITTKCIDLDEVNRELVCALTMLRDNLERSYRDGSGKLSNLIYVQQANDALKKAGAL